MKYGRKNHPPDDKVKFEIFVCYVLEKLMALPDKRSRGIAFDTLTYGRDDIEEVRKEVFRRWNK